MIVADSSYIVEGILRDASLLENEVIIAPDLALYEIMNTLWKHEVLIRDLENSSARISLLLELVSTKTVQLVRPDEKLIDDTYRLSVKHKAPVYDTIFIALALELGLELKSFDERQVDMLSEEERSGKLAPPNRHSTETHTTENFRDKSN
jgi:predicted nucleic acid-binding protein